MKKYNKSKPSFCFSFQQVIPAILIIAILFLSVFIGGCSLIALAAGADRQNVAPGTTVPDQTDVTQEATAQTAEQTSGTTEETAAVTTEAAENEDGDIKTNVYYSNDTAEYLVAETRTVSSEAKFVDAIYEMMKEPTDPTLVRLIPETTRVLGITVEQDGIAKLDLSSEFLDDRFVSDTVDHLLIYTVVNTLTEFDEINSVVFYIEGEKLNILGQISVSEPIFRRDDLIKN